MEKTFFPKTCILCGATAAQDFCEACFKHLPAFPANHCTVCSKIISSDSTRHYQQPVCGACLTKPPAFTATCAALIYTFPIDALIHALKYQSQLAIAPILGKLLVNRILSSETYDKPDLIIPMPLHPHRLKERSFNQALEIARHVARSLDIKLIVEGCKRIKNTPPQTGLPWKSRQKNVHKAFYCSLDLSDLHVAVIDDVMTTGATLNELAVQLRKQGAIKVTNWVIARVQAGKLYT